MHRPIVIIRLDGNGRVYRPGEVLSGEFRLSALPERPPKALEVSVLWYTEGKGDPDMAVHEFWRYRFSDQLSVDLRRPQRFSTQLPNSPLSYEGQIVKLRWCVRVRVFLADGKEVVGQKVFRLGGIPPAKCIGNGFAASQRTALLGVVDP